MKACATCGRLYPDDAGFCQVDGAALISATQARVVADGQDPRIGQIFCQRYQVRRVVADGGMGRVYEALDMAQRQHVALKILHPEVADNAIAVQRFKREFEVSQKLVHPHIVQVLDFKPTHDNTFALVMEFLYGEELRATLKRESVISPARMIRMLSQVALALDEAHAKNFVHRDLKPDNLFLCQTREGDNVKILDFGSVKDRGDGAQKLTVHGTTIGSPFYMAPEQAQGLDTLDQRADVWALSAIVYECVAGRVPFSGTNGPSILLDILTKEPKPASVVGRRQKHGVPAGLDAVLAQSFKKNPALRTPSVGALADAVGVAYGLSGTHHDWAKTPEAELSAAIDAKLPSLVQAAGSASDATDTDALDELVDELASAPQSAKSSVKPSLPAAEVIAPAAVRLSWGIVLAVGGGALLVGVLIVLMVFLAR